MSKETGLEVMIEMNEISNLVGKLLTIADASFQDEQQREAVKSLIKRTVWKWGKQYHFAATLAQIQAMAIDSELCEDTTVEEQIKHYEED